MKKIPLLVPAVVIGILGAAMVVAAPQSVTDAAVVAKAPDRAAAYVMAIAD